MISRELSGFLMSPVNNPLLEPQPPGWTFPPSAPKPTGIGQSGARMLGIPVNTGEAQTSGSRTFAPAKCDCFQPLNPAASDRQPTK
jgi:hypothetical protein